MASQSEQGYLVLADISGFTSYLAGVELEHAHEILSDLLEIIVNSFKPVLTLSKLEGDAVFAYAPESRVTRGETLLEILETTYVAFRNRLEAIRRRTTCECNACRSIPKLDLKFMAHYGGYILQSVAGGTEVIGSDVNLAHRLMKNQVSEATGWRAYALFSEAALTRMNVWPDCAVALTENYEHLGDVKTHSLDLHKRYKDLMAEKRVMVTAEEADTVYSREMAAPPAVVWTWLNDPQRREIWMPHTRWTTAARPGGRTGAGTRNHCAHGKSVSVEEILDWRPFEYYTCVQEVMQGKPMVLRETYLLTPIPETGGTTLQMTTVLDIPRVPRWINRQLCRLIMKYMAHVEQGLANIARLTKEDMAGGPEGAVEMMPALVGA
jgi:hypothetical protein